MNESSLRRLLAEVAAGRTSTDAALDSLRRLPFADIGFARVDHHRELRQGFPEAVYAPGKTQEQCIAIVTEMLDGDSGGGPVLLTRAEPTLANAVQTQVPGGEHFPTARLVVWRPNEPRPGMPLVICAGTSDLPVADEAAATLGALGWSAARVTDVGVAGIHRLLAEDKALQAADIVIVVAGMEGALASAVGGLVAVPVVAVPTSAGYGASFEGLTALLAMLASCAPGISVVGIDNGFGAACSAARFLGGSVS